MKRQLEPLPSTFNADISFDNISFRDIYFLDMKTDDSKRNRTTLLVLLALSHEEMHGYEISKFIDAKSKGFFRLPFGSLYPVLHRLEKEKLISAKWDSKEVAKPRKTYSLSSKGHKVLEEELAGFRSYTKAVVLLIPEQI